MKVKDYHGPFWIFPHTPCECMNFSGFLLNFLFRRSFKLSLADLNQFCQIQLRSLNTPVTFFVQFTGNFDLNLKTRFTHFFWFHQIVEVIQVFASIWSIFIVFMHQNVSPSVSFYVETGSLKWRVSMMCFWNSTRNMTLSCTNRGHDFSSNRLETIPNSSSNWYP